MTLRRSVDYKPAMRTRRADAGRNGRRNGAGIMTNATTTMDEIKNSLIETIDTLEQMQVSLRSMLCDCTYVVQLEGGFLRYSNGVASLARVGMANRYTKESAKAVAATVSNGDNVQGRPVKLVDAVSLEKVNARRMLASLDE